MRDGAPAGWRARAGAVVGGCLVLVATGLAVRVASPLLSDVGFLLAAIGVGALASVICTAVLGAERRVRDGTISNELDALSTRLRRFEMEVAALDGSGSRTDTTLADMAKDVHSLSKVVQSLAETLTSHEEDIQQLKQRAARGLSFQAMSFGAQDRPAQAAAAGGRDTIPSFLPARDIVAALLDVADAAEPRLRPADIPSPSAPTPEVRDRHWRLDMHLEPILGLPQRRERLCAVYPMLTVGEDCIWVSDDIGPALQASGAWRDVEASIFDATLDLCRTLSHRPGEARMLLPLSAGSLRLDSFLRWCETGLAGGEDALARLVVQIPQENWDEPAMAGPAMSMLLGRGMSLAIGGVRDLNLNPPALARRGVSFVVVSGTRLAVENEHGDVAALVSALSRAGLEVIAEAVDDDRIVPELIEIGVTLARGLALALPYPSETLSRPGSSIRPAGEEPASAPPVERSLRDVLRRAL